MKLTELNPRIYDYGGKGIPRRNEDGDSVPVPEKVGVGISFDCPCGKCNERVHLNFKNPISGGDSISPYQPCWQRTGYTFENMTLTPSIQRMGKCRWHGYLTDGELKEC